MPALTAERLEAVRGGVHLGREVEGGRAAHRGVAAARADVKEVPLVVDADQDPALHPAPPALEVLHVQLHNECVLDGVVPVVFHPWDPIQ